MKTGIRKISIRCIKRAVLGLKIAPLAANYRRGYLVFAHHMVPPWEASEFEETIRFISEQFEIVPLTELVKVLRGSGEARRPGLAALTFDDGFQNHCDVVYPILQRHSIPATFFVCADLVGTEGTIWTWEIQTRLQRLNDEQRGRVVGSVDDPIQWMKTLPVAEREQLVREIVALDPDFRFTSQERDLFALMSWDQLASLDDQLITIGAHTLTHIDLTKASGDRLEHELGDGKRRLEDRLGRPVNHFCYPNGDHDSRTRRAVANHYESAVTSEPGLNRQGDDLFKLRRVDLVSDLPGFAWNIARSAFR